VTSMHGIPHPHDGSEVESMRQDWEERARTDLLYSIDAQRRDWTFDEFYARGPILVAECVDPVLQRMGVNPSGRRVLEVGCGIGRLFAGLADRFGEVWGIDISSAMIEEGRKRCPVAATWLIGDGISLKGVDDASVDHVLSFEVFGHIPAREIIHSYLRETLRVLRPGGTFQVQLRQRSDSARQATIRAMPRPLRVAALSALRVLGIAPVPGDIDTWLGLLVPPGEATSFVEGLGFVDVVVVESDVPGTAPRHPRGYWLVGRKPDSSAL
jgi:SAM-dependent methyltransferase